MTAIKQYDNPNRLTRISSQPGGGNVPPPAPVQRFDYSSDTTPDGAQTQAAENKTCGNQRLANHYAARATLRACRKNPHHTPFPSRLHGYGLVPPSRENDMI